MSLLRSTTQLPRHAPPSLSLGSLGASTHVLVNDGIQLTEYQQGLCAGRDAYFFLACVRHFGFLVSEHGYVMAFSERDRGGIGASFTHDIQTEYFAVRIACDAEDLPWCDIHRFAGTDHQIRLRLPDACEQLGISLPPDEHLRSVTHSLACQQRIQQFAECIRACLDTFRSIPIPNDRSA